MNVTRDCVKGQVSSTVGPRNENDLMRCACSVGENSKYQEI